MPIRILLLLAGALSLPQIAMAEQRKDAAERVQEGSVVNWLEYYRRERALPAGESMAAPNAAPKADSPAGDQSREPERGTLREIQQEQQR